MTTSRVDLHLHTTASDGALSPTTLIELVASRGLWIVAVTDHDSTEGIAEAQAAALSHPGLRVIPGIELGAEEGPVDVHILGYFLDIHDERLQQLLATLRSSRIDRARQILSKLDRLGMHVPWDRLLELSNGGAIGRLHIAQALFEGGYVSSLSEAFDRYIGLGKPAYVSRYKLTPAEAVQVIRDVGGVASIAHPLDSGPIDQIVRTLARDGLGGLECYYAGYAPETVRMLVKMANDLGLVPTGGTDFHGREAGAELPGSVYVPLECAERLAARAAKS